MFLSRITQSALKKKFGNKGLFIGVRRNFSPMDPEKFEKAKQEWENNRLQRNIRKAEQIELHDRMADLLQKNFDSINIDDQLMNMQNIFLEPIR